MISDLSQQISRRLKMPNPLPSKMREDIWQYILKSDHLRFFILPNPRPCVQIFDRATADLYLHTKLEPGLQSKFVKYKYNPVENQSERGSCGVFDSRVEISKEELIKINSQELIERYGQALVFVASQKMRDQVLGLSNDIELSSIQYCLLERIGRSRTVGEFLAGSPSLQDILSTENKVSGSYLM